MLHCQNLNSFLKFYSGLFTWSKEYATKFRKDAALWVCRLIGILAAGQTDADSGKSGEVSGKNFPKMVSRRCDW